MGLTRRFIHDLDASWQCHGRRALERMAVDNPAQYVRVYAALMPREVLVRQMPVEPDGRSERELRDELWWRVHARFEAAGALAGEALALAVDDAVATMLCEPIETVHRPEPSTRPGVTIEGRGEVVD